MLVLILLLFVLILVCTGNHCTYGGVHRRQKDNIVKDNFDGYDNDGFQVDQNWILKNGKFEDDENEAIAIFTEREGLKTRLKYGTSVLNFAEFYLTEEIIIYAVNEKTCYRKQV